MNNNNRTIFEMAKCMEQYKKITHLNPFLSLELKLLETYNRFFALIWKISTAVFKKGYKMFIEQISKAKFFSVFSGMEVED